MHAYLLAAIAFLNAYGPSYLHYDPARGLPSITYTTQQELAVLTGNPLPCEMRGAYNPHTNTMYFPRNQVPGFDIVVHETVHFVQDMNSIPLPCPSAGEYDAYTLQNLWATHFGYPPVVSQAFILDNSRCR